MDPMLNHFCELDTFVLITKMAAVFKDMQLTVGQRPVQVIGIFDIQKRIFIRPENIHRHRQQTCVFGQAFAACWIVLEVFCNESDAVGVRSDIVFHLRFVWTVMQLPKV